jgi:hypothetical protein
MKALVLAGLTLMPIAAFAAAPYCVIYPSGRQCKYYTLQECRDAAGTAGVCVENEKERPEEKKKTSGNAPFCVVTRDETRCWYYDEQRCREAAASANAGCVSKQ